ncbi:MAG: efflux RND transporter periplasmic adaptor subunit [Pseudomonadota bacterium]
MSDQDDTDNRALARRSDAASQGETSSGATPAEATMPASGSAVGEPAAAAKSSASGPPSDGETPAIEPAPGPTAAATQASATSRGARAHKPSLARRLVRIAAIGTGVLAFSAGCVAAMVGGITLLKTRADLEKDVPANPAISVQTQRFTPQDGYTIKQRFVGRVEPLRQTQLAFELAGTVMSIAADEGQRIKAGAQVARLDRARLRTRLAELQAQKRELQARLSLARATAGRQRKLNRKGWTPSQRFDEARFQVAEIEAGIGRVEAGLEAVRVDLRKAILRAPFDGIVAARQVDEGAIVAAGAPVLLLMQAGAQRIRVGVSRQAGAGLKIGERYRFEAGGRTFMAKLEAFRPDLDPTSRTMTALFRTSMQVDQPYGAVVTLALDRRIETPGAWVPTAALNEGAKGLWTVLTVVADESAPERYRVRREAAEILHVSGERSFIRSTIPPGTRFISNGTNRVTPGQQVALLGGTQGQRDRSLR